MPPSICERTMSGWTAKPTSTADQTSCTRISPLLRSTDTSATSAACPLLLARVRDAERAPRDGGAASRTSPRPRATPAARAVRAATCRGGTCMDPLARDGDRVDQAFERELRLRAADAAHVADIDAASRRDAVDELAAARRMRCFAPTQLPGSVSLYCLKKSGNIRANQESPTMRVRIAAIRPSGVTADSIGSRAPGGEGCGGDLPRASRGP